MPWLCCTALGCAVLPCLRRVTLAVLQCRGAELRVLLDLGMWATSSTPDLALCRDSVLCVASGSPLSAAPLCGCRQLSWAPDAAAVCCVCAHVFVRVRAGRLVHERVLCCNSRTGVGPFRPQRGVQQDAVHPGEQLRTPCAPCFLLRQVLNTAESLCARLGGLGGFMWMQRMLAAPGC